MSTWWDFSALPGFFFDMSSPANGPKPRFFLQQGGAMSKGARQPPTYEELVYPNVAFVPRAPKDFYALLPADKRERDYCLVWFPPSVDYTRLITAKTFDNKNAGRIYDPQRNKFYAVQTEWDYLRQGNLHGVVGSLIDAVPPTDLPPPPP